MKNIYTIGMACLIGFSIQQAHATSVSLVGGASMSTASISPSPGTMSYTSLAYGGGALLGFQMTRIASVELGGLYMPRGYQVQGSTAVTMTTVQVPLLFRVNLLPAISIGAGGYGSYVMNTVPSGINTLDYGLEGSLQIRIPIAMRVGIILDGRYLYGLANASSTSGTTTNLMDIQALAGLRFGM